MKTVHVTILKTRVLGGNGDAISKTVQFFVCSEVIKKMLYSTLIY